MICSKCGKKFGKKDLYCPHCGEIAVPYQPSYKRLDEQTKGGLFRPKSYDDFVKSPDMPERETLVQPQREQNPSVRPAEQKQIAPPNLFLVSIGIFFGMMIIIFLTVILATTDILWSNSDLIPFIFPVLWFSFFFGIAIISIIINRKR